MSNTATLAIGESFHLRRGKDRIIYAGMPQENVYSIVQVKQSGYQGYAWNLFFPRKKQELTVDGVNVVVESVTPEEISIRAE